MSFAASRPLPLMDTPTVALVTPGTLRELDATRRIFRDHADALGIDLAFQGFEQELASLPGDYTAPRGALLLALLDAGNAPPEASAAPSAAVLARGSGPPALVGGCCALRPFDTVDYPNAAEMKRLYVRPAFRGLGLGRQLAEAILDAARAAGYASVLLDTLDEMETARMLYQDLGFVEVPPYYHNPVAGAHYFRVDI
ncbi:MAG: N-acetyltransferase [Variovorax sp.]